MEGHPVQNFLSCIPIPTQYPTADQPDENNGVASNFRPTALDAFPPGYRFLPTDEELIVCYLARKVHNLELPPNKIGEVNLYEYHPQELAGMCGSSGDQWVYFFTPRDRKYKNGNRPNRVVCGGYWKATGADKDIKSGGRVVGAKKSLVFYVGNPSKGSKTNWIMHEFVLRKNAPQSEERRAANSMTLNDWVVCRISNKARSKPKGATTQNENDQVQMQEIQSDVIQAPHPVTWQMPEEDGRPYNENEHLGVNQDDQVQRQEIQSHVQAPHPVSQDMQVSYSALLSGEDGMPYVENELLGVDSFFDGIGDFDVAEYFKRILDAPPPQPSFDFAYPKQQQEVCAVPKLDDH